MIILDVSPCSRLLLCRGHVNLAWLGQHEQNSDCAFDAMYTGQEG
jgi:hypothetical protein